MHHFYENVDEHTKQFTLTKVPPLVGVKSFKSNAHFS